MAVWVADGRIANKQADIAGALEQARWKAWKTLSAAFGAGIAVASELITLANWIPAHFFIAARAP